MIKTALTAATLALSLVAQAASADSASGNLSPSAAQEVTLAQAEAAFSRYLEAWNDGQDATAVEHLFTDEASVELRLATRPEWVIKIDGASAIAEYVQQVGKVGTDWRFGEVRYFPTLQKDVVFVQYDARTKSRATGEQISYRNLVVVTLDQGRIARLRDFNGAGLALRGLPSAEQTALREQAAEARN